MLKIEKDDLDFIKETYDARNSARKADSRRIVRLYNKIVEPRHPLSEEICACSIRPYLVQLYYKVSHMITLNEKKPADKNDEKNNENTGAKKTEDKARKPLKKNSVKKSKQPEKA